MAKRSSRSRSRRRGVSITPSLVSSIIIGICMVVIVAGIVVAANVTGVFGGKDDANAQQEQPIVATQDMSADIAEKITQGTALTFGSPHSPAKPMIAVVGDPEELSRAKHIVNGKPSDFLNAVKDSKVSFFYYPVSEDKELSTDSLTRAAICRLGGENTKSGIFTLNSIVKAGDKLTGNENVKKVSAMMGIKKGAQCPTKTNEAASQTSLNADFFREHFNLGRGNNGKVAVVVDNKYTTHADRLPGNWVERIIGGETLDDILS